jgi:hypothetical protein
VTGAPAAVEISTDAAPGHHNEDFAAANANGIVLLDGAGLADVDDGGCVHGVAWYAHHLGNAILRGLAEPGGCRTHLRGVLADAIERVAGMHCSTCDLNHPGTPTATVVVAQLAQDRLSYLVLADSTLVIRRHGTYQVITDAREAHVGATLRGPMDAAAGGSPEHHSALRDYVAEMRAYRNRPGGYWVAGSDPDVAEQAITGSVPLADVESVGLFSDGATRLVYRFGLRTWSEMLTTVATVGPAEVIRQVREAERSDPTCSRWPRAKVYDDATIAFGHNLVDPVTTKGTSV